MKKKRFLKEGKIILKIIFEGEGRKYKMKKKDFGKKEKFKMKICRQHNFNENKNSPKRKKMTADE